MSLLRIASMFLLSIAIVNSASAAIYVTGHADIGVGFEDGGLHLHLHAEDEIGLFGGGTLPAGEYEPGDFMIGVPNPSIGRPAGSQWNFLASAADAPVWFLPQSSDPDKPFLGMGTEELMVSEGWTTPLTWTFNSISKVSGEDSEFAIWQNDSFGNPQVFASSLVPTAEGNSWTQTAFSHDHFNFGFTGQGIYEVNFSIAGTNAGTGSIAAGDYFDRASFRFATGSAVPEPNSLAMLICVAAGAVRSRRRK
ncbi:MAG: choice-of-anchor M domain-containing protein [bacterium]|nr:choice-of-anchor M domain-containing protein [bacterium]